MNERVLNEIGGAALVRRFGWGAMLASHGVWFVQSFQSVHTHFESRLALAGAIVFFALKLCDVRCLRFRTDARSLIAAVLVVALLHTGVIDRYASDVLDVFPWAMPLSGLVGLVLASAAVRVVRRIVHALRRASGPPATGDPGWSAVARTRSHSQCLCAPSIIPRAPPVAIV